jgi:hypothetical protein
MAHPHLALLSEDLKELKVAFAFGQYHNILFDYCQIAKEIIERDGMGKGGGRQQPSEDNVNNSDTRTTSDRCWSGGSFSFVWAKKRCGVHLA